MTIFDLSIEITAVDRVGGVVRFTPDPSDFFDDISLSESEHIWDLVQRAPHAHEFVKLRAQDLQSTDLTVTSSSRRERFTIAESFWGDAPNRSILRREFLDGAEVYWLRILEIATPEGTHFLRLDSDAAGLTGLREHTLVTATEGVIGFFP